MGDSRLINACKRADSFNMYSFVIIERILKSKADFIPLEDEQNKAGALILDDFGVQPLDAQSKALLLDIIEDRHGKRTTIITSQVPVKKWHGVIGEKTLADAIFD